ncbi:hypothetical protein JCM3775_000721 [Rhodotorula graminis]|uniref:Sugar phosphate transporter domain-containing protein n=1 Tax=Rhodotorula graminis (strain WP1) TaxID=578459 RepID=A0A194S5H1_RHOGW|nr:uncharacterized protein RHOBADRAFT_43208 [Rhodotorula graminis WP1]KPV75784.1 hypothetical protein RHOBADRAFT_43208 [Rhodotorula graminis WP1]
MAAARGDYTRVPVEEGVELKNAQQRSQSPQPRAPAPRQGEEPPASRAMVVFSVGFYLVAAIVMIMVNKWVLNKIQIPLFFLFCQLGIAVILLQLCALFGYMKLPRIDVTACKSLWPLIACNVLGLAFNTYCLQYVDASFYQIARGLVLPFTVFFSWYLLGSKSSQATLIAIVIVCIGFGFGVSGEIHTTLLGTMLGVASSVTTAVHAIVVKRSLGVVSGTLDLAYYSNLLSAIVIAPFVILSGEVWVVFDMLMGTGEAGEGFGTFMTGALVTGVFGFLICIAGFLSIKVTSPISHMISAAVRGVLQTFLSVWVFGDKVTSGRGFGIVFILTGSIYYVYTKSTEQSAARPAAPSGSQLAAPALPQHHRPSVVSAGQTPGMAYVASLGLQDNDEKARQHAA